MSFDSSLGSLLDIRFMPQIVGLSKLFELVTDNSLNLFPGALKDFLSFLTIVPRDHRFELDREDEKLFESLHQFDFKVIAYDLYRSELAGIVPPYSLGKD